MCFLNQKTSVGRQRGIIGVFPCLEAAGQALDQLVFSGFPLAQVFLVGNHDLNAEQSLGVSQARELLHQVPLHDITRNRGGFRQALLKGSLAGSLGGVLLGLGLALLSGAGAAVVGVELAAVLLSGCAFAATGGLVGALVSLGITENEAKQYAIQISKGNYLLIVAGTRADIFRAEHILHARGIHQQSC